MRIYFSASTGGFYIAEKHSRMPEDAKPVSDERYASLLAGQEYGQKITPDSNGEPVLQSPEDAPLNEIRDRKIAEIDQARDAAIVGGFDFNGTRFDSDAKSIQRINGAVTLSLLNPAFETDWITFDNSVVRLNAAQLAGLGAAAGQHEAAQIFRARQLKDQALAATTREQLAAITW